MCAFHGLLRIALGFGQGDISMAFAEGIGRIYGSSTFGAAASRAPESRVHRKATRHGLAFDCEVTMVEIPVSSGKSWEIIQWPILLPRNIAIGLIKAGRLDMLMGDLKTRRQFWRIALLDFEEHAAKVDPDSSGPFSLYGDEATIFRKPCMCLQWQCNLNPYATNSSLSRFLIAVIPSEKYHIDTWADGFALFVVRVLRT